MKQSEKTARDRFKSAYTIKGQGVGVLELRRAAKSPEFVKEVGVLVRRIRSIKQ